MLAQIAELELLNIIETHKATKMEGLRRVLVMLQHQDPACLRVSSRHCGMAVITVITVAWLSSLSSLWHGYHHCHHCGMAIITVITVS